MRNVPIDIVGELKSKCHLSVINYPFRQLPVTNKILRFFGQYLNNKIEINTLHNLLHGYPMSWPLTKSLEFGSFKRPMYELMFSNVDLVNEFNNWLSEIGNVVGNHPAELPLLHGIINQVSIKTMSVYPNSSADNLIEEILQITEPTILVIDITECPSESVVPIIAFEGLELNQYIFTCFFSKYSLDNPQFNYMDCNQIDLLPLVFVQDDLVVDFDAPMMEAS